MSAHPREAERHLKRINICDDVWYNIFECSARAVIGLKIAPLCARLDGLVDRHFNGIRRWTLGTIIIRRAINSNCAELCKSFAISGMILEKSALLDVPPPSNLVGFNQIRIWYIDQSVIEFLRRICHLFSKVDTALMLPMFPQILKNKWHLIHTYLMPLITQRLYKLVNLTRRDTLHSRNLVSPTILRDYANLTVIFAVSGFPEMPADDGAHASNGQALAKWLHTPSSDRRPKVFTCYCHFGPISSKLEGLKMAFVSAQSAVSFIICAEVLDHFDVEPFECENQRTRERLTFERTTGLYRHLEYLLLKRGPIWWGKSEWADSERRAKASFCDLWNEKNLVSLQEIEFDHNFV